MDKSSTVSLEKNPVIKIKIVPGHFASANSHFSHYIDMSELKTNAAIAKDVAKELAIPYLTSTLVDTIVCMDGTEVIGAYLAEELLLGGTSVMNSGCNINIVTPVSNVNRKLVFQSNIQKTISSKNTILLVDSVSSGNTIASAIECIDYYGGTIKGISALFNAAPLCVGYDIFALFTSKDIPEYRFYAINGCVLCDKGRKLDAIINREGYTMI